MALAAIIDAGFFLRLHHVRQPFVDNFSWRQASTAMMAANFYRGHWNIFMPQVDWTGPGPSYQGREFQLVTYTTALLWKVFGQRDAIGRLIGVFAGTWGLFAFFQLVRRVWDEDRALLSAGLLALMPGAVFIDRSFLPDPTMLSLLLTGSWLLVAWLLSTQRSTGLLGVALGFVVLAFLAKLPGLSILPALGYSVYAILQARGQWTREILPKALRIAALAMVPIVLYYAWAIYLGRTYPPFHIAGQGNWIRPDRLPEWLEAGYFLPSLWQNATVWLWTWPLLLLMAVGLLSTPSDARVLRGQPKWFFHAWLVGGVVLWIIAAKELRSNVWNMHVLNPIAAAFGGLGLYRLACLPDGRTRFGPPLSLALVTVAFAVLFFTAREARELMYRPDALPSRSMGLALRDLAKPDDLVVTIAHDVGDPIGIYYSGHRGWVFPPAGVPDNPHWNKLPADPAISIRVLNELRQQGARWMAIAVTARDDSPGREGFWENHRDFVSYIDATCEFVAMNHEYVIYRIPPAPGSASVQH